MVYVRCYNSIDVQALQARSDERLYVKLVSLESLRVASESYELLHRMVEPTSWLCGQIDLLSLVAGVALELLKVERDLLPRLLVREAKLDGGVAEALLLLKNSALALVQLGEAIKEKFEELDESFDDAISDRVIKVGEELKDTADQVLRGQNIGWLQERLGQLVQPITSVLATPIFFI